jgi:spore maturation protein CgeB
MLRANLEVLARRDPELVTRIGWPVDNRHVTSDPGGALLYQVQQTRHWLSLTPEAVAAALGTAPVEGALFVFGVGSGELVEALRLARPMATITAWDRDPWLLRLALQRHDWTEALTSGRLRLQLGTDLVAHAAASDGLTGPGVVLHPLLGAVYQNERWLLEPGAARRPLVALGAGGLFTDDLASALRGDGYAVYTLDIHRLSEEELARSLRVLRPAFLAAINYTDGLAEFAAAHGCKLVVWEIDPATSSLPPCRASTEGVRVFTYRRANVAEFRAAGFTHVAYLPLAADPERRRPVALSSDERARYEAPVAFVGSSLAPQKEGFRQAFVAAFSTAVREAGMALVPETAAGEASAVMDDVLGEQRRDLSRYLVPALLSRRRPDLARAVPRRMDELARLLAELAAADKRAAAVARLVPHGIAVWGDEGWRASPAIAAAYRGPAGHVVELTRIYNAALINLDVGRLYQDDIVTMRVFDVLACGGFVLAEYSAALGELFDLGSEIDCYRTLDEMEAKVVHYLAHPEAAWAIAARGRQAVLARHTISQRVRTMLASLR